MGNSCPALRNAADDERNGGKLMHMDQPCTCSLALTVRVTRARTDWSPTWGGKPRLRHPNIVRYRRIFVENHRLYILMDLIEGASLKEHITSVKEKRQTFSEDRIWNIVIQMVLALRYLHKDKQIVHRDLKPNNIMIAENDRVVRTLDSPKNAAVNISSQQQELLSIAGKTV
ncbi:hypothetical protein TELCIR_01472 [Teladorsagia circumcincta]|uniref:Protein kinase domain-containing protein n=1 Tax=Teladorsagia circumcincta TaxID=45464 RepID=A0A2G9V265_TELCI|nr:hypothetical protein TELCIR_01472 [Teladorsagia circumcincta]